MFHLVTTTGRKVGPYETVESAQIAFGPNYPEKLKIITDEQWLELEKIESIPERVLELKEIGPIVN